MELFVSLITQIQMQSLLNTLCTEIQSTDGMLQILGRFTRLKLPELKLREKYEHALVLYQKDLERIQDQYNADRLDHHVVFFLRWTNEMQIILDT